MVFPFDQFRSFSGAPAPSNPLEYTRRRRIVPILIFSSSVVYEKKKPLKNHSFEVRRLLLEQKRRGKIIEKMTRLH